MLDFILENKIHIGLIFILIAAISGSYYLFKTSNVQRDIKYFAWFLWFVFLLDLSGLYSLWAFFDNYKTFPFLKDSLFTRNVWLHNWIQLITISFYSFLFIKQIERIKYKRILNLALLFFILFGIFKLASTNQLFFTYDMSILIVGVLLLIIAISTYYFDLILSDKILYFKNNLLFYASIGLLIWHLCVPPIQIYSAYFSVKNVEFINMYTAVLRYCNSFMYGMFSYAFIYCAQKKQHPGLAKIKELNKTRD